MKDFNIPVPEGYLIDIENSNLVEEVIKFKKAKILNWKDFIKYKDIRELFIINQFFSKIGKEETEFSKIYGLPAILKNYSEFKEPIFANIEEAKSITALIKLLLVRNVYVGDWKPDWLNSNETKYVIIRDGHNLVIYEYLYHKELFSFPTEEMAELFLDNNRELLEEYFNF